MVTRLHPHAADINFHGKHADEELVLYYRQHWIRLLRPLVKLFIWNTLIFCIGYLSFSQFGVGDPFVRRLNLSILTFFFLVTHFDFLDHLYRYFLYVVVVTDKKVHRLKKTLLTIDDHQSIDLWMLQDINKCQHSIVQNLLGFGTIILEAQETALRMHFTPQINDKYAVIMHLREQARAQMTFHGYSGTPYTMQSPAFDHFGVQADKIVHSVE